MIKILGITLISAGMLLLAGCPTTPSYQFAQGGPIAGFPPGHDMNPMVDNDPPPVKAVPDFQVEQPGHN